MQFTYILLSTQKTAFRYNTKRVAKLLLLFCRKNISRQHFEKFLPPRVCDSCPGHQNFFLLLVRCSKTSCLILYLYRKRKIRHWTTTARVKQQKRMLTSQKVTHGLPCEMRLTLRGHNPSTARCWGHSHPRTQQNAFAGCGHKRKTNGRSQIPYQGSRRQYADLPHDGSVVGHTAVWVIGCVALGQQSRRMGEAWKRDTEREKFV
jgi:hypothetical protein